MSIDPKETAKKYEIGLTTNNWGEKLNTNMEDIAARLDDLEALPLHAAVQEKSHETLGIVAGAATLAAIGMSTTKPVSRRGMFNLFRSKNAAR